MAQSIIFNGVSYSIPDTGDSDWGLNLTNYFVAIPQGALQKTGGTFTLTSEVDFGSNFGAKVLYVKSEGTNIASAGFIRIAKNETITWRNNLNNGDLSLSIDGSNNLLFNGVQLTAQASALTPNDVVIVNGSGKLTSEANLAISRGGTGAGTQSAGFDALSPLTTKGDMIGYSSSNIRVAVGSDGQVWTADSASAAGVKWATPASAPTFSSQLLNLGLSTLVGSNQLTINLKQADGSTDPSSGASAVQIGFRNSTSSTGSYSIVSATSAKSITVSSGATLGQVSGMNQYVWVYALNNAGTVELAVSGVKLFDDYSIQSTTAMSGSATSGTTLYSTTSRSNVPIRLIGRLLSNQASAGTWATGMSEVSLVTGKQPTTITEWASFSPTFGSGLGVVSVFSAWWRRVCDSMQIKCTFTTGTVSNSSNPSISLPSGVSLDSNKLPSTYEILGVLEGNDNLSLQYARYIVAAAGVSTSYIGITRRYSGASDTPLTFQAPSAILNNTTLYTFGPVQVPISGWSTYGP